jgi:hypothetical protein
MLALLYYESRKLLLDALRFVIDLLVHYLVKRVELSGGFHPLWSLVMMMIDCLERS